MIIREITGAVGIIRLNRPEVLNALCDELIQELVTVLKDFETDEQINVIMIVGDEKAFAAGADIKEMHNKSFMEVYEQDYFAALTNTFMDCRKPVIAAVAGYALGGGCELAMMCDFILAADNAKFGQPEIKLGIIPGAGGTQRLARYIGQAKAMEICFTGRMLDAAEAERVGLVSRVVPLEKFKEEVRSTAKQIASYSRPALMMLKEAIKRSQETSLTEGLRFERRLFHSLFATEDQKEGMSAFLEKRQPLFKNK